MENSTEDIEVKAKRLLYNCTANAHNYNERTNDLIENIKKYYNYFSLKPKDSFSINPEELLQIYGCIRSICKKMKNCRNRANTHPLAREPNYESFGISRKQRDKKLKPIKELCDIFHKICNEYQIYYMYELACFRYSDICDRSINGW